ncbi:hypothetical protein [Veillonella magna]|uniref:hypothetical protein n=1 Tax=Veillonella magna TaxID=464322 RepID=UPI0023F2183C|nr:hypothetical protein [Veillonella magna]
MAHVTVDLKALTTTQTRLANALGITQQRVSQLIKDGIVVKDKNNKVLIIESLKNYYKFQHTGTCGDDADEESLDYMAEKAKHERTKREIAELKLAKMERNAYSAHTVELVLTEMLSNLRAQLLGLPTKLAPQLEGMTKETIYSRLTEEIEDKLSELSEYSPALFDEEVEDSDEDSE